MTSESLTDAQQRGRVTDERRRRTTTLLLKCYTLADRGLRVVESIGAVFAAALLLVTMGLISLDALLRYFFNAPLSWTYNLVSTYLLVALVCMPMAWGFRTGGYIRVTGIAARLPPACRQALIRAGLLLSFGYIGTMAWKSGEYFLDSFQSGGMEITLVRMPTWVSWIWVPAGLGLLSVRLLLAALAPAQDLGVDGEPAEREPEGS